MADRIIKADSGNDVVIQNNGGTRKIEVTNAGNIEFVGDLGFTGDTDSKFKLPSAGGIYESDGSTEVLTESSGTATLKNTVIDGTVSMASSGLTVRNIEQVALASDQSLNNSTTFTAFFQPTYNPKFSGSKVMGCLSYSMYAQYSTSGDGRKHLRLDFVGSDITDINFGTEDPNLGGFIFSGGYPLVYYMTTVTGPLITTSGTSQIQCNCKLKNNQAHANSEWKVFGDNTLGQTHFTWIEYK